MIAIERYNHGLKHTAGEGFCKQSWEWADQYAYNVVTGEQAAPKNIIKACQRYINDRESDKWFFSEKKANRAIKFCNTLKHVTGDCEGSYFKLEPWQIFLFTNIFGFLTKDIHKKANKRVRRFRSCDLFVPRKNGKTFICAAIAAYGLIVDREAGAQVVTAGKDRGQAKLCRDESNKIISGSDWGILAKVLDKETHVYTDRGVNRMFSISRDAKSAEGLNCHIAICDELHTHKTAETYNVLKKSNGARSQPLMFGISTCGSDMESLGMQRWQYSEAVLDGVVDNDSHFAMLYGIDSIEEWEDENAWIKANPNMFVSRYLQSMRDELSEAQFNTKQKYDFVLKNLNFWVECAQSWLEADKINSCIDPALDIEAFAGRDCYIGCDIAKNNDLSALTFLFPNDDGTFSAFFKSYTPKESLNEYPNDIHQLFKDYRDQGFLTVTDGNTTDFEVIANDIKQAHEKFNVKCFSYDNWGSRELRELLKEHQSTMVEVSQAKASMSEPSQYLERLILKREITFESNSLFKWQCLNAVAKIDDNENIHIVKESKTSPRKIDNVVSTILALAVAEKKTGSVYENKDIQFIEF